MGWAFDIGILIVKEMDHEKLNVFIIFPAIFP